MATPQLVELHTPFEDEEGVVRVLEPPGADRRALLRRLKAGTYDKAFVADDGTTRTLHFSKDYLQSSMRLDDPYALEFGYTRKIMAFLLFLPRPRNVLMLGLGGGSLAKFCHRQLPETRITVVESDATVLGLRDQFLIPPDDERFRVVLDEGAAYLRRATGDFDAILVDAFDKDGCAPTICSPQFYVAAHGALAREGLMVSNIVGAKAHRLDHLDIIRTAFDDNVILLPVVGDGNHLAFAFRDPAFEPRWKWIAKEAKAMKGRYGLDFPKFAEKLERSRKMGYVRRHSSQAAFSE